MKIPPNDLKKDMHVRATLGKTSVDGVVVNTYFRRGELSSVDLHVDDSRVRFTMWDYTKWEFEQVIEVPQKKFAVIKGRNESGVELTFCRLAPNQWTRNDRPHFLVSYDDDDIRRALATGRYTIVFEGVD